MSRAFNRLALTIFVTASVPVALSAQSSMPLDSVVRAEVAEAATTITIDDIRRGVAVIADDSMMGRDTPSRGLTSTADYIERRFAAAGLAGFDGSRFQQFYPLSTSEPGPRGDQELVVVGPGGPIEFTSQGDFVAFPLAGVRRGEGRLIRIDGLSELSAASGAIAVIKAGMGTMPQLVGGPGEAVSNSDVAGVVVVMDMPPQFFEMAKDFFTATGLSLGDAPDSGPPVVVTPLGAVPAELRTALSGGEAIPGGWTARLQTMGTPGRTEAMNTIGVLRGSDARLRDEVVLFIAHMDGQGVGDAVAGDSIYNSADDNATGTAVLIELAEAFAALPQAPRRSVAFMAVSGEEKNLLGSRWYVENPAIPLENTVAVINMDMIGRNWTDSVLGIGMELTTMEEMVQHTVAAHPELNMGLMRDRWPQLNLFARSDSYPFALAGVPIIYFQSRGHQDYHQPTDQLDRVDYDKLTRLGRLIFHFAYGLATVDEKPQWLPGALERVTGR